MTGVPQEIIDRQLAHFDKVDQAYGDGIREALKHQKTENAGVDTSHAAE
jgi:catalase